MAQRLERIKALEAKHEIDLTLKEFEL